MESRDSTPNHFSIFVNFIINIFFLKNEDMIVAVVIAI